MIGLDGYQWVPEEKDIFIARTKQNLQVLCEVAQTHGLIPAMTETGMKNMTQTDWWSTTLLPAVQDYPISYLLTWRNYKDEWFGPSTSKPDAPSFKARVSLVRLSRLKRMRLAFLKYRSRLLEKMNSQSTDSDAYAVVAAMALGDKSALNKDLKDVYSVTGASHVLALSGLHLGIIYTLLSLFAFRRRWQVLSQVFIILSIWAFVFLVGLSTSVVRSAMMLSVYALLSLGHRDKMSVNTLAFTAMIMLMLSPMSLFDIGFQMSYMAVFSILLFIPLLEGFFSEEYLMSHRFLRWFWGMVAVSLSAQIGTAPLIAYYFGRLSCYFLLTNFIVIPAAMLILYLSLAVLLIPSLAHVLYNMVTALNYLLSFLAAIPGACIDNLHPTKTQTTMIYLIIVAVYLLAIKLIGIRASARYR